MNDPSAPGEFSWWPNSPESEASFGLNTYGPDVELDFIFNFMERQHEADKPFFIYHTTHLGHGAFDWFFPESENKWPGTPIVEWNGQAYERTEPVVTGDRGVYDTHDSITGPGMHNHIQYIDYQVWCYLQKLKQMGVENKTLIMVAADNGSWGYGKNSPDRQKGCHVPLIIYAPGIDLTKQGEQDILLDLSDMLPTLADVMGVTIPKDYQHNGTSFWPWLTTGQKKHRDWIYCYRSHMQLIRGKHVMKDGFGKWWDVSMTPEDLISYRQITNWKSEDPAKRRERKRLLSVLPQFDAHATEHDAPGMPPGEASPTRRAKK